MIGSRIKQVVILAALILFPLVVPSTYLVHLAIIISIYSILTLSISFVGGTTGLFSFGHSAFYGAGAYTSALLALKLGLPFIVTLPMAGVMAGLLGLFVGLPSLKAQGFYLGMITLGFGEVFRLIMLNWSSFTRGPMGLVGIPAVNLFGYEFASMTPYYYLGVFLVLFTAICLERLRDSRLGEILRAIREDEVAAQAMGIRSVVFKVVAFGVSGFFAGLGGALMAHYMVFIGPGNFTNAESMLVLTMNILGGPSIIGSITGATVFTVLPEVLRGLKDYRLFMNGVLLLLFMNFRPGGMFPEVRLTEAKVKALLGNLAVRKPLREPAVQAQASSGAREVGR